MINNQNPTEGLLTALPLLAHMWPDESSRPSLRWLREQQSKRTLPYLKIGKLVFFDPAKVRAALAKKFTVESA
jgi:hypothetical protein